MMKLAYGNPIMKPLYEVLSAHLACWSRLDKCWFPTFKIRMDFKVQGSGGVRPLGIKWEKSGCRPGQRMGIPGPRVLPLAGGKMGSEACRDRLPQHFPPSYPGWGWRGEGWAGLSLPSASPQSLLQD